MAYINKPKKAQKTKDEKYKIRRSIYQSPIWRALRIEQLSSEPLCAVCLLNGRIELATDVHHIVSFVNGSNEYEIQRLAWDKNNVISLCKKCHGLYHAHQISLATIQEAKDYTIKTKQEF